MGSPMRKVWRGSSSYYPWEGGDKMKMVRIMCHWNEQGPVSDAISSLHVHGAEAEQWAKVNTELKLMITTVYKLVSSSIKPTNWLLRNNFKIIQTDGSKPTVWLTLILPSYFPISRHECTGYSCNRIENHTGKEAPVKRWSIRTTMRWLVFSSIWKV